MPYIVNTFQCCSCGHEFEEMWMKKHGDDSEKPWEGIVACPDCEGEDLKRLISATGIATFSIMDRAAQMESLKKRSSDHTKKLMKTERDRIQKQLDQKPKGVGG